MALWITDWIANGRPSQKKWSQARGYYYDLPDQYGCSTVREMQVSPADREAYYKLKPGCRGSYEKREGMTHSASAGGFIGAGVTAPADAKVLTYTPPPPPPPPIPPPSAAPIYSPPPAVSPQASPSLGFSPTAPSGDRAMLPGIAAIPGIIQTGTSLLTGGRSKCPGPYNYNPQTGGCDPKPDYWDRVGGGEAGGSPGVLPTGFATPNACPTGYVWDGARCKAAGVGGTVERILPGGETGYGMDVYGEAVVGAFGKPALVPYVASVPTARCPPGAVLGKDNLCYAKGSITNAERKWPKPTRPLLSAGDMKTLRKINSLQNKVKRAWQVAGKPGQTKHRAQTCKK